MKTKIALSIIAITLMLSTLAVANERKSTIQWEVTICSLPGQVYVTTYYLDNYNQRCLVKTEFWNGINPYIRTENIWPGQDPPPMYMCAEAVNGFMYD